jgi:hypothetical protein
MQMHLPEMAREIPNIEPFLMVAFRHFNDETWEWRTAMSAVEHVAAPH